MKIYCVRNTVTGKAYIGMTSMAVTRRWGHHLTRMRREAVDTALYGAIRKYGPEAFRVEEFASLIPGLEWSDLCHLERDIIAQEDCRVPNGYNMTEGGDGTKGYKPAGETLERMRSRKHSAETRAKMSAWQQNRPPHTPEALAKIGASAKGRNLGRVRPPEEIERITAWWTPERRAAKAAQSAAIAAKKRLAEKV